MQEKGIGTTSLEDLLSHERQEPWGRKSEDRTANAPLVIDREEPDSLRLEGPTLAIGAACCVERHGDPDAIGGELVRDRLSKCFGPSMHFHFNRRHAGSARADEIRSPTEDRDLDPNIESGIPKPGRNRFTKVGLETECHKPRDVGPKENGNPGSREPPAPGQLMRTGAPLELTVPALQRPVEGEGGDDGDCPESSELRIEREEARGCESDRESE